MFLWRRITHEPKPLYRTVSKAVPYRTVQTRCANDVRETNTPNNNIQALKSQRRDETRDTIWLHLNMTNGAFVSFGCCCLERVLCYRWHSPLLVTLSWSRCFSMFRFVPFCFCFTHIPASNHHFESFRAHAFLSTRPTDSDGFIRKLVNNCPMFTPPHTNRQKNINVIFVFEEITVLKKYKKNYNNNNKQNTQQLFHSQQVQHWTFTDFGIFAIFIPLWCWL